ncbi:unnamed protein product [Urochloa decumbens]|uniref:FORGETTER1 first zinc ribbon domain-containing protein n=1 Tax=Urochloa decumbens TaxID=240449 RepID=A0ABC9FNZ2_9POAL
MAARPAAEEDLLEVRCAGCGETLEVERGLTEFACPDCATPQALPPELMPPPPPRRRRAVPLPSAPARAAPPPASAARLPCGACGPGLARCGCPVCGAELAVDPARLRRYLEATAAPPLVPVSPPPVFQAREVQQEYPDSAVRVGHIQGYPNNRLVHVERSQIRCRNTKALSGYPDAHTDRDDMDTEVSDEINAMHCHRSGFSVDSRASNAKRRRQVEALNHVVYQVQSQQTNYSVHAEGPDHAIHVGEAHNKYLNHAVHKKRQAQTLNQIKQQEHAPSIYDTQTQHIEPDLGKQAPGRTQKRKKKLLTVASNNGLQVRCSKCLAPESNAVVDTGPLETDPPVQQVASPYQNLSDLPDIDGIITNLCPGSSIQVKMPQLHSTEPEPFNVAELPASDPYLDSHNEVIIEPGMDKTRTEFEPGLIYQRQGKAGPPKLLSPIEQWPEHSDDNIRTQQDESDMGQLTAKLTHKNMKRNLTSSSNEEFEYRHSKRLAKQSAAITYYGSGSEGSQAASSSQSISSSLDIDQFSDDSFSSLQPQHDMPQRSSNEAGNLDVTMQTASSIPDMTDPESFARYYSKVYPPEVRRANESNSNVWLERVIHQSPSSYLHAGKLKFAIAPVGEIWTMKALGKKWKDWKAILKHERYDVHETDEERLADRDSRVPEEQWKCLVAYWGTEKAKAASARCRALRARQPIHRHRAGSKSYARIREEESRLLEEARKRQKGLASGSMDDVFSKIVGPDTRDTKRTYGPVPCTGELRGKTAAKVSLRLAHAAKRNAEQAPH